MTIRIDQLFVIVMTQRDKVNIPCLLFTIFCNLNENVMNEKYCNENK